MSKFDLEVPLTSYEITPELLRRLERYLLADVSKMTKINSDDRDYSISITDDLGTEKFKSIEDFTLPFFRDHTEEISISLNPFDTPGVTIKFGLERGSSHIRISIEDDQAREIGISIYKGIESHLESQKTKNCLFNFNPVTLTLWALLGGIGGRLLSYLASKDLDLSSNWVIVQLFILTTIILYTIIGGNLHPYTLFDSKRARNYKKWSGWLLTGFLTFASGLIIAVLVKFLVD